MILHAISLLSIAAFGLCIAEKLVLPVTTCKRNSSDYSACLTRAAQESWPRFVAGLPEFEFSRLDPLDYEYGKMIFDRNIITGVLIVSNVTAKGLTKLRFPNIRTHFLDDAFRLEIDFRVPRFFVEGYASMEGTVGGFRISPKGDFNLTAEDARGTWDITGHVINDTAIIKHFNVAVQLGKLNIQYHDSQGNQEFYDLVMDFVNEYWPIIYRAAFPLVSKVWDPWLVEKCNHLFSKVSFSELFPEN